MIAEFHVETLRDLRDSSEAYLAQTDFGKAENKEHVQKKKKKY